MRSTLLAALVLVSGPLAAAPAPLVDVEGQIAQGRALLAAGKPREAQAVFEAAAAADAQSLRTRVWVIRSWLPQSRVNDALDALDTLSKEGAKGPELDYLYGMAFAYKGREYMQQSVNGQIIDMAFADAVGYLKKATDADPVLYKDAFLPLAEAAWYQHKLDVARAAAERATAVEPANPDASMMLGRIALSQFVTTKEDAAKKDEADKHWEAARKAFDAAAKGFETAAERRSDAAAAFVELGHTYAWKQQLDDASNAYVAALARDPSKVDFSQILGPLGGDRFLATLEGGAAEFVRLHPEGSRDDDALLWWLGWSRFDHKKFAEADRAFALAFEKNRTYLNSWYYIALSRYQLRDYEGAFEALRRNWDEEPSNLLTSLGSDLEKNMQILDFLVGWCAENDKSFQAGLLSEMQANTAQSNPRFWNNMGLFYRDASEPLRKSENQDDQNTARHYIETAYQAYSSALELSPDDPSILNDTAVMLHYYLGKDLDRAATLYKKATERATIELARTDLSDDLRKIYETALRDSKNNLAKLEAGKRE